MSQELENTPIKRQVVFVEEGDEIKGKPYHPQTQVAAIVDIGEALLSFMNMIVFPEVDEKVTAAANILLQELGDKVNKEEWAQAIKYVHQELTPEQQRAARTNIGLGSINDNIFEDFMARLEEIIASNNWQNGLVSNPGDPASQYEYWTGKYYGGSKVYGKLLDFGTLPNNAGKSVRHYVAGMKQFINFSAMGFSNTEFIVIPNPDVMTSNNAQGIGLKADMTNVTITTRQNWSTYSAIITIEYICTDR